VKALRCLAPRSIHDRQLVVAYCLLSHACMSVKKIICDHCGETVNGKIYRVTSKDGEVAVLDMIVCNACYREARKLGLTAEELDSARRISKRT